MRIQTIRKHNLFEVASAMQKAIRRGDARSAGYWAMELFESNFQEYLWRRLLVISAEDCWGVITHEVEALYRAWKVIGTQRRGHRIFAAKAVVLLAQARKSRDADHLTNLVYDTKAIDEAALEQQLDACRGEAREVPDYALDCHTKAGTMRGLTRRDFMVTEHDALHPRAPGLFDADLEEVRAGRREVLDRRKDFKPYQRRRTKGVKP